jgi:hypothetical protein
VLKQFFGPCVLSTIYRSLLKRKPTVSEASGASGATCATSVSRPSALENGRPKINGAENQCSPMQF